jgi:hypothetical protein
MDKPRNRLTIGPLSVDAVMAARKAMWAGWLDDCERVRDEWIEARLDDIERLTNGI